MMIVRVVLVVWAVLGFWGCADEATEPQPEGSLPPFDEAACASLEAPTVQTRAFATGPTNNTVTVDGQHAWIVHSGNNTVGRLTLPDGPYEAAFVDVGNDRGPWDLALTDEALVVTHFVSDSISLHDRTTGQRLAEHVEPPIPAPTGVAQAEGVVVVAASNFVGPGFGAGQVHVLRIEGQGLRHVGSLQTSALNPLDVVYDPARRRFLVVCAGEVAFEPATEAFKPVSGGAVDVLGLDALLGGALEGALETSVALPLSAELPFAGNPRTLVMAPGGDVGYLPSGSAPHLYKLDLETLEVLRGPDDPIVVYLGDGNQLTGFALRPDGVGYVTAFNQDALYLFDSQCDASVAGPFGLGDAALLEGPLDVAYDPATQRALVLMSVSSFVTVVR